MELINRATYLDRIISHLGRGVMIILVGQRRVGKSYLLWLLQEWLGKNKPTANVLYINKEMHAFRDIADSDQLYEYAASRLPEGGNNYLLIDEVQDIARYEDALRSLHAEQRCQIVATGSNAYIFSSEISTRLSGRYVEVPIYSLTYEEFLRFHRLDDSDDSVQAYLRIGGLPGLRNYAADEDELIEDYLQGVYNTVMLRDVVSREEVRNVPFIENLAHFVADNVGKPISPRNIANTMKSQGSPATDVMTAAYLRHLCNALIITVVPRYDIHGKHIFEQNSKYYFADHGLRNLLCGFNLRGSIEKLIENVVYHHLVAQRFDVKVGVLRNGEVDFVATRGDRRLYIQATYLLASDDTIKREFGNLAAIRDNHPKYVVSMDPVGGNLPQYPGITHLTLRQFLTAKL